MLFRLAPTPSGYLHLGNAVNFVLTWLAARQRGAKLLLRIDDLDAARKRPEYVNDIFRTLDFLGLDYDLGPISVHDFEANWSQRHRLDRYVDTLDKLRAAGVLYPSALSRREVLVYGATYRADSLVQSLSLDTADVAWRFRAKGGSTGDFVVLRRDGLPAYQIASLTDDHDLAVTHLVRGQDLFESTDRQRQLALVLGWADFLDAQVWHHPVLLDKEGNKLSKSAGHGAISQTPARSMCKQGCVPTVVYKQVARFLNAPSEVAHSLNDLLAWGVADNLFTAIHTVKLS